MFDLYTDHQALTLIFSKYTRPSNAKVARWATKHSQLRFKVYHKAGTLMGHADGLSPLHQLNPVSTMTMRDLLNPVDQRSPQQETDARLSSREDCPTRTDVAAEGSCELERPIILNRQILILVGEDSNVPERTPTHF